jgi:hypothetical protein
MCDRGRVAEVENCLVIEGLFCPERKEEGGGGRGRGGGGAIEGLFFLGLGMTVQG